MSAGVAELRQQRVIIPSMLCALKHLLTMTSVDFTRHDRFAMLVFAVDALFAHQALPN